MIAPGVVDLTSRFREANLHITIETAGTVYARVECDLMSISPKLSNSTPHDRDGGRWAAQHDRLRYQPDVLRRLMSDYAHQLKFVVSTPDDLQEIDEMQRELGADAAHIMVMPEGTSSAVLHERSLWLVEICKERGYRLSPRLHVDLWGDRRGV
jgi:7-carboxy-7-deazaguanine synthase